MRRGRRRKFDPTIPAHIAQDHLPVGVYWDNRTRVWYTLTTDEHGRRRRTNRARANAKMSELVAIAESLTGDAAGTVAAVLSAFHGSLAFQKLAQTTRRGYEQCRAWAVEIPSRAGKVGTLQVDRLSRVAVQQMIENIAERTPSKANAILRYLRRVFRWAQNRGHCTTNPAEGVEPAQERQQAKVPDRAVMASVIAAARDAGQLPAHTAGSCPPYLWIVMELAYLCRLRSIEVLDLTDASETPVGIEIQRRKGSRGNLTLWNPRLRAVWDAAVAQRAAAMAKAGVDRVTQIRPADRQLIRSEDGTPLKIWSLRNAFSRFMRQAIADGLITADQRFSLHGLKHRGITDTPSAERRAGGGHVTDAMAERYDHDLPSVGPASE